MSPQDAARLFPEATDTEAADLRRCIRDLVALSTLPAAWIHAEALGIVESLSEVVLRMLNLDLAYVRLPQPGGARLEAGRTRRNAALPGRGAELGRVLEAWLGFDGSEPPRTIPSPDDSAPLNVAVVPVGHDRDCGWLVGASRRAGFPGEHDRLLLGVAANQLAMVLQRKSAEDLLRDSAARLAESDRRKDEFLATLAHELRNPLAPMRNGVQLLRLNNANPALAEQARAMMERQLEQMVRLVDDLLDMSRISLGKIELRREWAELGAIVHSAVESIGPFIERSGHTLELELPAGPLYLDADPVRLAQVFSNLLNNAAKYTERGGTIVLAAARRDAQVEVSVRDNGIGIPPQMLPRVFDMFTQVDHSLEKAHGGLGIGLTIVKRLVELHGGTVQARSEGEGRGSEFIVRLPLREPGAARRPAAPAAAQEAAMRAQAPARRILVVDDNADSAASLAMLLQALGNEASTAPDGPSALEAVQSGQPDLVLLDIGMPGMSGYEACQRIRAQPWGRGVTLVALSGWGQEEHKARARAAGFDHYLVKPVDPEALRVLIGALRDRKP